jgi:hypothetical protein
MFMLLALSASSSARAASITGFLQSAYPEGRFGTGFAVSLPLLTEVISLEGEYSRTGEKDANPSLVLWSGNLMLVSPAAFAGFRPYLVGGPLHFRFDYRVIQLRGDPLQQSQKRLYGGLSLRF